MVRPRLVEEGVPVGSSFQPDDLEEADDTDHTMMMQDGDDHHGSSNSRSSHPESTKPRSSLQQAAGTNRYLSSASKPRRTTTTNITIGGGSNNNPSRESSPYSSYQLSSDQQYQQQQHNYSTPHSLSAAHASQFTIGGYPESSTAPPLAALNHSQHEHLSHQRQYPHQQQYTHHQQQPNHLYAQHAPGQFHHPSEQQQQQQQQQQSHVQTSNNLHAPPPNFHSHETQHSAPYPSAPLPTTTTTLPTQRPHRTNFEIGADYRETERMEGVEDHSIKPPLVVLDGANIAYAYGGALQGNSTSVARPLPDVKGIQVAVEYFQRAELRVLVVLPASWFRKRPQQQQYSSQDDQELYRIVQQLERQGQLVPAPPTDDDDAYALTIAQRENARSLRNPIHNGPGYVVSNDLFRDAQNRDASGKLREWLMHGNHHAQSDGTLASTTSLSNAVQQQQGPGRISYTFCDMGAMDDHGDRMLDFVPNPRHALVAWVEATTVHHHPDHPSAAPFHH